MKWDLLKPFFEIFDTYQPIQIGEIGTHDGRSGLEFCRYCLEFNKDVNYTGYDAFGLVDGDITFHKKEKNGKKAGRYWFANKRFNSLKTSFPTFSYELIEGFTKNTLKETKFDFVYIDAGHSYESVKHDYEMVKESKVIVLDDYYHTGVKKLVDEIIKERQIPVLEWKEALVQKGLRFASMPRQGNEHRVVIFKE